MVQSKFLSALFFFLVLLHPALADDPPVELIDPVFIRQTGERLAELIRANYFDQPLAEQIADRLQKRVSDGWYDDAQTAAGLAESFTADLFDLTNDKHLMVAVKAKPVSSSSADLSDEETRRTRGRHENFGIRRAEILDGNVGYLNLSGFYRPEEASDTIATAMHFLRYADALIVDLRSHSGGSPDTTAMFVSYFLEQPELPLFKILDRSGGSRQYASAKDAPEDQDYRRPTFLLTSKQTFSAGEGLAFLLQEQGRAEVVGETTAGAANPGRSYDINSSFEVTIPNGKVVSAIRGGNWEGTGVRPDVAVASKNALRVAHSRALAELKRSPPAGKQREMLQKFGSDRRPSDRADRRPSSRADRQPSE